MITVEFWVVLGAVSYVWVICEMSARAQYSFHTFYKPRSLR
jgi:hypothetical protein